MHRLMLDEDVDVVLAPMLRSRGHSDLTARDLGQLGLTDEEQLVQAALLGAILVTHNRVDFERLALQHFEQRRHHSGIILLNRRPPREMARRIATLLHASTVEEFLDQVRYV